MLYLCCIHVAFRFRFRFIIYEKSIKVKNNIKSQPTNNILIKSIDSDDDQTKTPY